MQFEFATSNRILFGAGRLNEAGALAKGMGSHAFVASGGSVNFAAPLLEILSEADVEAVVFPVSGEPTVPMVQEGVRLARQEACDLVIGFGGGSSMDMAKAVATLLTNPGDVLDYLEVVGLGQVIKNPPAPCIAIPTTAGTGSEVTRNAVISSPEHQVKASLRSPLMLPRLALVDPELTYSLPPEVTASTGLDALTQLVEPYVSLKANPLTDAVCREGIRRAGRSLLRAYQDGMDMDARQDMSLASLFGGLALANAALGAVHGFSAPFGGKYPASHGAICARLLPLVMEANVRALQQRQPSTPVLERYREISALLTGNPSTDISEGIDWVKDLVSKLNIPALSRYGFTQEEIPGVAAEAAKASSMKGNPIPLTGEEMALILQQAL